MALAICALAFEMSNFNANVKMDTFKGQINAKVENKLYN
jgi:hypothetical protein